MIDHPVQTCKRQHQIKLINKRQTPSVRLLKPQIGKHINWEGLLSEGYHFRGIVDPYDSPARHGLSDLSGDLAIAAAYIKDGLIALESEVGQYLIGPVVLLGRMPMVILRVPVCHVL